jgi:simple sugar transport system permease protein
MNKRLRKALTSNEMMVVYIIFGLSLLIGYANSAFWGVPTLISLSRSMLVTLIFALCEMVIIISGGIDVSFPAVACMSLYATAKVMKTYHIDNILFAFVFAGMIGLIFGILNAYLVAKKNIPPLIATLGVSSIANGATLAFLGTKEISQFSSKLDKLSKVFLFSYVSKQGIQYSMTVLILVPVILCFVLFFVLKYTMLGRGIFAIGGDANAARIAGFNVTKSDLLLICSPDVLPESRVLST